jgi:transposase
LIGRPISRSQLSAVLQKPRRPGGSLPGGSTQKVFPLTTVDLHREPAPSLVGMEAGVGSHFLGRALRDQGHEVRLIPAQFVRPFVKSNKNDYRDAEAVAEAVERENMRFVPIKTEDQLDLQAVDRVRDRLVARRTSVINQIRAFLLERGISFRKGPASLRRQMPEMLENGDAKLSTGRRRRLDFLWQEWKGLQSQIESLNTDLEQIASREPSCVRLQQMPGVGPLISTAVVSAIGNVAAFKKGREFAAWLDWCHAMVNRRQGQAAGYHASGAGFAELRALEIAQAGGPGSAVDLPCRHRD